MATIRLSAAQVKKLRAAGRIKGDEPLRPIVVKSAAPKPKRIRHPDGTEPERALLTLMQLAGLPPAERDFRFHPIRRWHFDFAYPDKRIAVEVEGGIHLVGEDGQIGGRHNRASGYEEDCRKYSAAALLDWVVIRVTPAMIANDEAVPLVREALERRAFAAFPTTPE